MSVIQKLWEVPLAQDFVYPDGNAVGKVQAAAGVQHGQTDAVVGMLGQQCLRQTGILPPEHQIGAVRVLYIGVAVQRFCGKSKNTARCFW